MSTITTRFNPSLTGHLHLGHIYLALVNVHFAESRNGKCILRIDDTSPPVLKLTSEKIESYLTSQTVDLFQLGIYFDAKYNQSGFNNLCDKEISKLHKEVLTVDSLDSPLPIFTRMIGKNWIPMPYYPRQTLERVITDHVMGITHVIRGEEWATEFSLYSHYCELLNYKVPQFIFLPRLSTPDGIDVSKTNGGFQVRKYLLTKSSEEVLELLKESCLRQKWYGWELFNIKPDPIVIRDLL